MADPIILTVDDDPAVSQAITRDLRSRYGDRYRIAPVDVGRRGVERARGVRPPRPAGGADRVGPSDAGDDGHRVPRASPRTPAPDAKLVLLTAYADTDVAIRAINDIGLDHYLMKPWAPPEERLFPVLDDLLERLGARARRPLRRRPGRRQPLVGAQLRHPDVPGPQPRAVPVARARARCRGARGCSALFGGTRRRASAGAAPRRHRPARCRRRASSPTRSDCGPAPSRPCTTSSWSAPVRRVSPPRCTARRRGCTPRYRTRRARRAGRPERAHRELPRLPQRAQRLRPLAPGGDAGAPARRRDGARPRRRGARAARARCTRSVRRRHRDRGPSGASSPPACRIACSKRRASPS